MIKLVLLLTILLSIGCDKLSTITSPSNSISGNPNYTDLIYWYPCIVVQTPGVRGDSYFETQMSAVRKLHRAGRLDWIRLGGVDYKNVGRDYAIQSKAEGIKVFSIMDIEDLEIRDSWEASFDELYAIFPEVDIWEIGGEISNGSINSKTVTPEYYMEKFKSLVRYVEQKYGRNVSQNLTSAPTLGSGGGPHEFERFIQLGLLDMDVIIAVNVYDFSSTGHTLQNYASIFSRYSKQFSHKRIWITETGSHIKDQQLNYVETFYPQLISAIHPEMICYYVLFDGDDGVSPFGMISGVFIPPYVEGDLFKRLVGGR